jgi:hypothetical protein
MKKVLLLCLLAGSAYGDSDAVQWLKQEPTTLWDRGLDRLEARIVKLAEQLPDSNSSLFAGSVVGMVRYGVLRPDDPARILIYLSFSPDEAIDQRSAEVVAGVILLQFRESLLATRVIAGELKAEGRPSLTAGLFMPRGREDEDRSGVPESLDAITYVWVDVERVKRKGEPLGSVRGLAPLYSKTAMTFWD